MQYKRYWKVVLGVTVWVTVISCVSVPSPKSELPYPYQGTTFEPKNPFEEAYSKYLKETPMFPDTEVCERILPEAMFLKMVFSPDPSSVEVRWVTPPFLATGKYGGFFSVIEAHLTYGGGEVRRKTFSCAVRYAGWVEEDLWREGKLMYLGCVMGGHGKFIECSSDVAMEPGHPGKWSTWHKGIRHPD